MQNNNNINNINSINSINSINNFNNPTKVIETLIYDPKDLSVEEQLKNIVKEINNTIKETRKKMDVPIKNLTNSTILLFKKNKNKENSTNEIIMISPAHYYEKILSRIYECASKINEIKDVFNCYLLKHKKEANEFIEEELNVNKKFLSICKGMDSLVDFYYNFFNNIKKLDPKKTKKVYVDDFEYEFSKKLNALYETKKEFEKKLEEFKNMKNNMKNLVPEKLKEHYYGLLDVLLYNKNRLIKKYDVLMEDIKETNEFSEKNLEDLIKYMDAILENSSYYFNLIEGVYTKEAKEKLNEMENKVKICLISVLKFMEYLEQHSLDGLAGIKEAKTIFDENENLTKKHVDLNEKPFSSYISYSDSNLYNEKTNYYKDLDFFQFVVKCSKEPGFKSWNVANKKEIVEILERGLEYTKEMENVLRKIKNAATIEEIKNCIKNIGNFLVKKDIKKIYDFHMKTEKMKLERIYNFDVRKIKRSLSNEEKKQLIKNFKENVKRYLDEKLKSIKRYLVRVFRNVSDKLAFKFGKDEILSAKVFLKVIQFFKADQLMKTSNLYYNTPSGLILKMCDFEDYLHAAGIQKWEVEKIKKLGIFNSKFFEIIKELAYKAETKQLAVADIKTLVKVVDSLKCGIEEYLILFDKINFMDENEAFNLLNHTKNKLRKIFYDAETKIKEINEIFIANFKQQ